MHTAKPKERKGTLMSMRDLQHELGYRSRQPIYDLMRDDPTFPKPIKLKEFSIAWVRSEFEAWLASRPRAEPCGLSSMQQRKLAKQRRERADEHGGVTKPVNKALGVII